MAEDAPAAPAPSPAAPTPPGSTELTHAQDGYPIDLEIVRQEEYSRFLPLIKWLLVLPHALVVGVLGFASSIVGLIGLVAVLFTGKWPRGMFDFVVGVLRWSMRVNAYALLMVDDYPPFTMDEDPAYPARIAVPYPEDGIANWRAIAHVFMAIPYFIWMFFLAIGAAVVGFIAFFAILFTREYPAGMFNFVESVLRRQLRIGAYTYAMTERYPPF